MSRTQPLRTAWHPAAIAAVGLAVLPAASGRGVAADLRGFIASTCVSCHGPDQQEGGVRLDVLPLDARALAAAPDALRAVIRVHDRVRGGEMPPRDAEQPAAADRQAFVAAAAAVITEAETTIAAGTGRATIRRLNRSEYEHTLRDLFSLPSLRVKELLPEDARRENFDKVAAGLDLSAVQMARYLEAATRAVDQAVVTATAAPRRSVWREKAVAEETMRWAINIHTAAPLVGRDLAPGLVTGIAGDPVNDRNNSYRWGSFGGDADSCAVFTNGMTGHRPQGIQIDRFDPPVPGLYTVRFSVWGLRWARTRAEPAQPGACAIYASFEEPYFQDDKGAWQSTPIASAEKRGKPIRTGADNLERLAGDGPVPHVVRASLRGRPLGYFDAPSLEPTVHEFTVWLAPGDRISFHALTLPPNGPANWGNVDGIRDYEGPGIAYDWFEVEGPLDDSWPPPSQRRLFGEAALAPLAAPSVAGQPPADAPPPARLLADFAAAAFRRPLSPAEVVPYERIVADQIAQGEPFTRAMFAGYRAILCAPDFLFIGLESGPPQPGAAPAALGPHAIASRLSYFLWDSLPDRPLLDLAASGRILEPEVLAGQVDRMLADPRSDRFVEHFLDEWLKLHEIDFTTPDPALYPEFDPWLRDSMLAETRTTFRRMLDEDRPVGELIDADTVMINQRLALLYGIPGVRGAAIRPCAVPAGVPRGGLLTQAAVLKVTANGTVTSPVQRGVWVMERLLGLPRLPPPAGTPAIEPDTTGATTIRRVLEMHRADPACAVCHARMDPYGFALERFDPIGGSRDRYRLSGPPRQVPQGTQPAPEPFVEVATFNLGHDGRVRIRLGDEVDAGGTLADGRSFHDVAELKRLLLADPDVIATNVVRQLTVYATGAAIRFSDRAEIARVVAATRPANHGLRSLVTQVVLGRLFRTR